MSRAHIKFVLVTLAAMVIPAGGVMFGQSGSLTLSPGAVPAGGSTVMNLSWSSTSQVAALEWTISYPAGSISSVGAAAGAASTSAGKTVSCAPGASGQYHCIASGMNSNAISNGVVATINLTTTSAAATMPIGIVSPVAASSTADPVTITGAGATLTIQPIPVTPVLSSVGCPATLNSQTSGACTVTLTSAATANTAIQLSSGSTLLTVPASVTIAVGATTATFQAQAGTVTSAQSAVVTAAANGINKNQTISLQPASSSALGSLTCAASIASQSYGNCTANLMAVVSSPTVVTVATNSTLLTVPVSVTVPVGSRYGTFRVTAGLVSALQNAVVSATLNGVTKSDTIALQPGTGSPVLSSITCPASINSGAAGACTVTLSSAAVASTPVQLASNSTLLSVPASVTFATGATTTTFQATAGSVTTTQNAVVTATLSGASKTATVSLQQGAASPALSSITCPASINSGAAGACTVTLSSAATANTTVQLADNSTLLTVPASVTVATGATTATFQATAGSVATTQNAVVTATLSGVSKTSTLSLEALPQTPALSTLTCAPAKVAPGASATCTVTLSAADTAASTVTLNSSNLAVTVPAQMTVAAGSTTGTFTANAGTVSSNQTSTITAGFDAVSKTATIDVAVVSSSVKLRLEGEPSEVAGTTRGSVVTPASIVPGVTGSLVVNGTGSVNFASAQTGNGVSFKKGGQQNADTAFYSFKGAAVRDIFDLPSGEINFTLKSSYSFAERLALPRYNDRWVFDVFDNVNRLYGFSMGADGGLAFFYRTGSTAAQYYVVPKGQEDKLFGKGVVLNVKLTWNGTSNSLYLNGQLVSTQSYVGVAKSWTATSSFSIGATDAHLYGGGHFSLDDVLDEFEVRATQP